MRALGRLESFPMRRSVRCRTAARSSCCTARHGKWRGMVKSPPAPHCSPRRPSRSAPGAMQAELARHTMGRSWFGAARSESSLTCRGLLGPLLLLCSAVALQRFCTRFALVWWAWQRLGHDGRSGVCW